MQFTCLTQTGSQIVLDDGNGQTIANVLNGPTSDLISQASYTTAAGGGLYSAYVGAIVDVVRIMSNLHTAQYQYIPAISFPQDDAMNLRLNTPPSFHNPKSVLVIALPAVQPAVTPPLRPADPNEITCLIKPTVVLPIEGAPLVFSEDFAHNLVLHLNTPPGAPSEPDIPLTPDAYYGGLVLQKDQQHHIPLHDPTPLLPASSAAHTEPNPFANPSLAPHPSAPSAKPQPKPVLLSGVILGRWGFDSFTGPTVQLQQLPGSDWTIVPPSAAGKEATYDLIAGHTATLLLNSTGSACVHSVTANPGGQTPFPVAFDRKPKPDQPNLLALTLPLERNLTPGDLHLAIQQYEQPKPDELAARTYSEPATVSNIELHASDKSLVVTGTRLGLIDKITVGDLVFSPAPDASYDTQPADSAVPGTLHFAMAPNVPVPSTHVGEALTASIALRDSRVLSVPLTVSASRPVITLLRKSALADARNTDINLSNPDDLPLSSMLTFTLKSPDRFPRNGEIEIETLDGTLRTVLTLAPSGGLLLQDPHTIVATLDPLRSFGPSAFGALRMRAVYPAATSRQKERGAPSQTPAEAATSPSTPDTDADDASSPASDWLPLVTLVRLPTLTQLQCPPDPTQSCTVTGNNFFLLQSISTSPDASDPVPVPDGYTGTNLTVPHPTADTIFFKLRDDPASIDSAILPVPAPPITAHVHRVSRTTRGDAGPASPDTPTPAGSDTPEPSAPGSAAPATTTPDTTTPTPTPGPTSAPATQPAATPQKPTAAPQKQESPALQPPSSPSTSSPSVS